MHSIILAYRNRPKHLQICLEAILEAAKTATQGLEVIVCEQDAFHDPSSADIVEDAATLQEDQLIGDISAMVGDSNVPMHWEWIDAKELFHKSLALNRAADAAEGDLLTVLDVDCIVPPDFFASIERFYAHPQNAHTKLSHRMLLVDPTQSDRILRFKQNHLNYLRDNPDLYRWNNAAESYGDTFTGCSQFTIPRTDFMRIGGFDEGFVGYGLEDTDFNLRAAKHGIVTRMNEGISLLHLHHSRESDWANPVAEEANRTLFHQNIADGHPKPEPKPKTEPTPVLRKPCDCTRNSPSST